MITHDKRHTSSLGRGLKVRGWLLAPVLLTGCDPLVSLQGSFWPPWIIVMVVALPMTSLCHLAFKRIGLADHLRPAIIVYPALWSLMTFLAWLIAFQW